MLEAQAKKQKKQGKNNRREVCRCLEAQSRLEPRATDEKQISRGSGSTMLSSSLPIPSSEDVLFFFFFLVPPSECFPPPASDSDNSLLRYLSDDKILVIEEEPEGLGRESRRDSTRRSRRKSRNPSSPSFPLSPSMLSSTLRLDQPPDALPVRTQSPSFHTTFFFFLLTNKYTNADFCMSLRKAHRFHNLTCFHLSLDQTQEANNDKSYSGPPPGCR